MAKQKGIKSLLVKVTSQGAKETNKELSKIEESIFNINAGIRGINSSGSIVVFDKIASSLKSINRALNGDTKRATQQLSAYIDNLDIVAMTLAEVERRAIGAASAIEKTNMAMKGGAAGLDVMNDTMEHMAASLTHIELGMEELISTMKEQTRVTKQVRNNISDLETVTSDTEAAIHGLGQGLDGLTAEQARAKKGADKLKKGFEGMTRAGSSQARGMSKLVFGMNPLVAMYASIAVNVYALTEAFRVLNEAAGLNRLENTTASFAAAISGINVKALATELQEVSAGALDMKKALRFATKGVSFNFTTQQLRDLTDGARRASIALGINFTDAMDRVTRGISKQEIELFDELGIVTRLEPAFKKLAVALGKNVDELTDYERQLALTNEVQRQLDEKYSGVAKYATGWERLGVAVSNFTTKILKTSATGLDSYVSKFAMYLEKLTPTISAADKLAESQKILNQALKDGQISQAGMAMLEISQFSREAAESQEEQARATMDQKQAIDGLLGAVEALAYVWLTIFSVAKLSAVTIAILNFSKGVSKLVTTFKALRATSLGVAAAMWAITGPVAAIAAAIGVIAGVVLYATGGFDFLVDKVKGLISSFDFLTEKQDKLKESTIENAEEAKKLAATQKEVEQRLISAGLLYDEAAIAAKTRAEAEKEANEVIKVAVEQLYKMKMTDAQRTQELAKLTQNYGAEITRIYGEKLPAAMKEAESTSKAAITSFQTFINGMDGFKQKVGELTTKYKEQPTALDKVIESMKEYAVVGEGIKKAMSTKEADKYAKTLKEVGDALGINLTPDNVEAIFNALVKSNEASKKFNNNFDYLVDKQKASSTSFNTDAEVRKFKLQELRKELENQSSVSSIINEKARRELAQKIKILEVEEATTEELKRRNRVIKDAELEATLLSMKNQSLRQVVTSNVMLAEMKSNELAEEQKILDIKKTQDNLDQEDIARQQDILDAKKQQLKLEQRVAGLRDTATAFDLLGSIPGLSEAQVGFAGLGSAIATASADFAVFKELAAKDANSLTDFFKAKAQSLSNVVNATVNAFQSIYQAASDAKVASIQREIEAEKRRDGQSAKSLAKIKKMQAEIIKEEAKAKKASIGMSTAMAVMQTFATMGFTPWGIAAAAAMTAMGAFQVSQVDKAANGQLAALGGGPTGISVTGGDSMTKRVDVAQPSVTDTYGRSVTRSAGGTSAAGVGIELGERGAETIVPKVPVEVVSAGSSASGKTIEINLGGLSINTIDTRSFEDNIDMVMDRIREGLEESLNAEGKSLNSL